MSERIKRIFSRVHAHYDLLNSVFSMGLDSSWRRAAASEIMAGEAGRVLDAGTGTGALALAVAEQASAGGRRVLIDATDFNRDMLRTAKERADRAGFGNVRCSLGDALGMGFPSGSFDVVASAFVLRNLDDLGQFLAESHRVLKKRGRFVFVDMALPDSALGRLLFGLCTPVILALGSLSDGNAYRWLIESIKGFDKKKLLAMLRRKRFRRVRLVPLASGIAFMVTGEK